MEVLNYNRTVSSIQENIGEFVQSNFDNDPVAGIKSLVNIASAASTATAPFLKDGAVAPVEVFALHNQNNNQGNTMQQTGYQDVQQFHDKFQVPLAAKPQLLDDETYNFRLGFMREELNEFVDSHYQNDLATALDSLIDLVYVAYGTAQMMGVTPAMWQEMWNAVQNANMSKVRAQSADESKRGTALDVVKPAGWVSPDAAHAEIIARYSK
jgi:predicted HAD superfamily Cof-like phosphohydrolase